MTQSVTKVTADPRVDGRSGDLADVVVLEGSPPVLLVKFGVGDTEWYAPTGTGFVPGPQGDQGEVGPTGDDGPHGPMGSRGVDGPRGDTGDRGPSGPAGDVGPRGPRGYVGEVGAPGPTGDVGPQGAPGWDGQDGEDGPQGPPGPQGLRGFTGSQGQQGPVGPRGFVGPQGDVGPTGAGGESAYEIAVANGYVGSEADWLIYWRGGPQGTQGLQGATGSTGARGPQGSRGDAGAQGPRGFSPYERAVFFGFVGAEEEWLAQLKGNVGELGPTGPQGPAGSDGAAGGFVMTNGEATTVVAGCPICAVASSLRRANASSQTRSVVIGLVKESAGTTLPTTISPIGLALELTHAEWDAVTGQSGGLTAGVTYYLSDVVAGRLATAPPTAAGSSVAVVGVAISTTALVVDPSTPVVL